MTPANDNDYQQLQRTIAELQVENERLRRLCREAADTIWEMGTASNMLKSDRELVQRLEGAAAKELVQP